MTHPDDRHVKPGSNPEVDGCICEFGDACNGLGSIHCNGCGGDQCVCTCGGELECDGCTWCDGSAETDDGFYPEEDEPELFV